MAQKLQKIRGRTLEEAYRLMRSRFGAEAVVISTQQVTEGGILGYFGQKMIEVTASVPVSSRALTPLERKYAAHSQSETRAAEPPQNLKHLETLVREAQQRMNAPPPRSERLERHGGEAAAPMLQFPQKKSEDPEVLRREVQEIREMLQVLYAEAPGAGLPAEFAPHYRTLVSRGVSRKVAATLLGGVVRGSDLGILRDPRVLQERLQFELRKAIRTTGGITVPGGSAHRVALCGATGVGKTTTLAKLAAHYAVRERRKVALVTSDTYRIAACEQLRVYANIIGVPIHIANDAHEMSDLLHELRGFELVLMDTPGGSQFNLEQINELKTMLAAARPNEVLLTMSAGTPLEDLRNVVSNFRNLKPTAAIFTKLDETRQYGAMFSLLVESSLPLSYVCVGQNVPDDIRVATPDMIARMLLEDPANRE